MNKLQTIKRIVMLNNGKNLTQNKDLKLEYNYQIKLAFKKLLR
jgi:hypothetical protein